MANLPGLKPSDFRARYINGTKLGFRINRPTLDVAFNRISTQITNLAIKGPINRLGIFKTHDVPSKDFDRLSETLPDLRIVTVRRDFKDVVVSRFFYYRYYWPTEPGLGKMSPKLEEGLVELAGLGDADALRKLVEGKLIRTWAMEWAAFETPFTSPRALRVSYEGMLDGGAHDDLVKFIGRPLPSLDPFTVEQMQETDKSGRVGKERFNRQGTAGQWMSWFSKEEGNRLDKMAARAQTKLTETLHQNASGESASAVK